MSSPIKKTLIRQNQDVDPDYLKYALSDSPVENCIDNDGESESKNNSRLFNPEFFILSLIGLGAMHFDSLDMLLIISFILLVVLLVRSNGDKQEIETEDES